MIMISGSDYDYDDDDDADYDNDYDDDFERLAVFGISRVLNEETKLTTGQMGIRGWMAAESMAKDGSRARLERLLASLVF